MNTRKKLFFLFLLLLSTVCYALPFTITPKSGTSLPISIGIGNTATAYYTISNNTQAQRNGNYIKYLPLNVTQVTTGGTYGDTCGATFNLTGTGQSGSSCTLQLTISGAVDSNDPSPHNHLFACFTSGQTCAGTNSPLSVSQSSPASIAVTPTSAEIAVAGTQQFTATEIYTDGSTRNVSSLATWSSSNTSFATINSGGLATGVSAGTAAISATFASLVSNSASLIVDRTAYITNHDGSTVTTCQVKADQTLASCATTGSNFISPSGITINPAGTLTYNVNEEGGNTVTYCQIGSNRALSNCTTTGTGFTNPTGIAINSANTYAYISNLGGFVSYCSINAGGSLSGCATTGSGFVSAADIRLNSANTFAYVANFGANTVSYCAVNGDGTLSGCTSTAAVFSGPNGLAINPAGTYLYVANKTANNVSYCVLNPNGSVGACSTTGSGFNTPFDITFNAAGTYAYVVNAGNNNVSYCVANADGSFGACATTGTSFNGPRGIVLSN